MLYIKNGKIMADNTGSIVIAERRIFNPTAEQLIADGWQEYTPPEATPAPKRYSKLKIIRALGDQWAAYKKKLEEAGLADEFWAANDLAEDDPAFAAFMLNVPSEIKMQLEDCIV